MWQSWHIEVAARGGHVHVEGFVRCRGVGETEVAPFHGVAAARLGVALETVAATGSCTVRAASSMEIAIASVSGTKTPSTFFRL